jgi:hypothetical protein
MNALEKLRLDNNDFKDTKDIVIATNHCPDNYLKEPEWCKGMSTIRRDCLRCWRRNID